MTSPVQILDYPNPRFGATIDLMPDYGSFCPVSLATEAVADRWTPLVIRELVLGNTRFNDIARGLPGISRSLLVQRLRHLERRGIVEVWPLENGRGNEYRLTPAGKDLEPVLIALGRWAVHWLYDHLDSSDVSPETLMWWMHRRVDVARLPSRRVVVMFEHTAPEQRRIWMLAARGEVSVCLVDPGFEVDAIVKCPTPVLAEIFAGARTWNEAVRSGAIEVAGTRAVVNALPRWFLWSPWVNEISAIAAARLHKAETDAAQSGMRIVGDDLAGEAIRALLQVHFDGMLANSPAGSCHFLDLEALRAPEVTLLVDLGRQRTGRVRCSQRTRSCTR